MSGHRRHPLACSARSLALLALSLSSITLACSSEHRPDDTSALDGGGDASSLSPTSAPSTNAGTGATANAAAVAAIPRGLDALRTFAPFADRIATNAKLVKTATGYHAAPEARAWKLVGEPIDVTLPLDARSPTRIAVPSDPGMWVEIVPEDAAEVDGKVIDGTVVYQDLAKDTDVVHVAGIDHAEEFRILRGAGAPTLVRYHIRKGPSVGSLRTVDGRVEVLDASGQVRLIGSSPYALDAAGKRHAVGVTLEESGGATTMIDELDARDLTYPVAIDPLWTSGALAPAAGERWTALTLGTGNILLIQPGITTSYLYNTTTNVWTTTGAMTTGRNYFSAVTLASGNVLVVGNNGAAGNTAEVYSAAAGTWTATANTMSAVRGGPGLSVLSGGKVLVTGGVNASYVPNLSADLYDPVSNMFTATASMATRRSGQYQVTLSTGKVLVVGGDGGSAPATSEIFDPTTATWSTGPTLSSAYSSGNYYSPDPGAPLIGTSKILYLPSYYAAFIYDAATNLWTSTGALPWPYYYNGSYSLSPVPVNGRVLMIGGQASSSIVATANVYAYDPPTNSWSASLSMTVARSYAAVTTMPSGKGGGVIVITGKTDDGTDTKAVEIFTPQASGSTCGATSDCVNGLCVTGYCCNSSCTTACAACNGTGGGTAGTCSGSCGTACTTDTNCTATAFCSGGVCTAKFANGTACTATNQCGSGNCIDGYCCNTSCPAVCNACDVPGSLGTCTGSFYGPPHGSRVSTCTPYSCNYGSCQAASSGCYGSDIYCATGYFCQYSASTTPTYTCIAKLANGVACTGTNQCSSGNCIGGTCCNTACTGYSCSTGTCPTSCTTDASCASGYYCNGATCVVQKSIGATCTATDQCSSGNCVDGYCCTSSCAGQCQACDVSVGGTPGYCTTNFLGPAHGSRTSCGPYACYYGSCATSCFGSDSYCDPGSWCRYNVPTSSYVCTVKAANGAVCTATNQCTSGKCVDGVCCNSACTGNCQACNLSGTLGTCSNVTGVPVGSRTCGAYACSAGACETTCTGDTDCGSGYYCSGGSCIVKKATGSTCTATNQCSSGNCVDGYCCNSSCAGQCQACDVSGSAGFCTSSFVGPAHGTRTSCAPYLCSYGSCGATCTYDGNCASGNYCDATGHCSAQKSNGSACSAADQCTSGNCVDGYCCNTSCGASACSACNVTGSEGVCTPVSSGAPHGSRTCAPYSSCLAGSCSTACSADADCVGSSYCKAGACVGRSGDGTACTASDQCITGNCVDGFCCNTSCTSQCAACDVGGSVGTCTPVAGAPHGTRLACAGAGAGTTCGPTCNGVDSTKCIDPPGGTPCSTNSCTPSTTGGTSIETHASFCDGAGRCNDVPKSCGAYACDLASCKSSCVIGGDCAVGFFCKAGVCLPATGLGDPCKDGTTCSTGFCVDGVCCGSSVCSAGSSCNTTLKKGVCAKGLGTKCTATAECGSGYCVDGVCCDGGCTGQCAACNVLGKEGTCTPVVGAPHGTRPACVGTGIGTPCGITCTGLEPSKCTYPAATACSANSCDATTGIETHVSFCNGGGVCNDIPKSCGAYACDVSSCKSACTGPADCASGFYCKSGTCAPVDTLGTTCSTAASCASGNCVDNVCCDSKACDVGSSCNLVGSLGKCSKAQGTDCTADTDCGSGHCVDGVCCDSACTNQCEACDVSGKKGTCWPVSGAPHGAKRPACDSGGADVCKALACDGSKDVSKCVSFINGPLKQCKPATCDTDRFTPSGSCDGAGGCNIPEAKTCAPYICDDKGCKTDCKLQTDCAAGNDCVGGKCVPGAAARCSSDNLSSTSKDGTKTSCLPYVCRGDGTCGTNCGSSNQCAPGYDCDPTSAQCIAQQPSSDNTSACGCEVVGSNKTGAGAIVGLLLTVMIALRRRRGDGDRDAA